MPAAFWFGGWLFVFLLLLVCIKDFAEYQDTLQGLFAEARALDLGIDPGAFVQDGAQAGEQ